MNAVIEKETSGNTPTLDFETASVTYVDIAQKIDVAAIEFNMQQKDLLSLLSEAFDKAVCSCVNK